MLYCTILCYAMLCCTILYSNVLYYAPTSSTILQLTSSTLLCYTILYYAILSSILSPPLVPRRAAVGACLRHARREHRGVGHEGTRSSIPPPRRQGNVLYSTILYYIQYYTVLYYTILYYTLTYYTILYSTTILYSILLYYTII